MEYWDIYALLIDRDPHKLVRYVRELLPEIDLDNMVGEYYLNIGIEELTISAATEFIFSGCSHKKSTGGIRLIGKDKSSPDGGWVYFNTDGSAVFGLTVKETISHLTLKSLKKVCSSEYAYVAGDCPPAENKLEFIKRCT